MPAINIATAIREDVDQCWSDERKASRTILNLSSPDDPPIVTKYMEERRKPLALFQQISDTR
jgi:hypothetical protein